MGNRVVRDWIVEILPEDAKNELIDVLSYMQIRPHTEWVKENFKPLEDGLSEIRFSSANSIWRVYGFFGPSEKPQSYTFLVGTVKKVKNDRDSKELAKSRRDQLARKQAKVHQLSFEG